MTINFPDGVLPPMFLMAGPFLYQVFYMCIVLYVMVKLFSMAHSFERITRARTRIASLKKYL